MIELKSKEEIEIMKKGGKILAETLQNILNCAKPGVTEIELEDLANETICKKGGEPGFKRVKGYSYATCISTNDVVVHGIPTKRPLKEGDVLGIDCGIWHKGLCTDMAVTVGIGKVSAEAKKLIEVTKKSLELGLKEIKPGNTLGDIGYAVQAYVEENGFGVVRHLVGHGVGHAVHEDPRVPNYYDKDLERWKFQPGAVIAIEPMLNEGSAGVKLASDGYTYRTRDGSRSAHFEHTIAVGDNGGEILTGL